MGQHINPESVCQHCHLRVEFRAGSFVHVATGESTCPKVRAVPTVTPDLQPGDVVRHNSGHLLMVVGLCARYEDHPAGDVYSWNARYVDPDAAAALAESNPYVAGWWYQMHHNDRDNDVTRLQGNERAHWSVLTAAEPVR